MDILEKFSQLVQTKIIQNLHTKKILSLLNKIKVVVLLPQTIVRKFLLTQILRRRVVNPVWKIHKEPK
jgi:hypothetical protein